MFYNVVFPGNSFVGILVIDPARAYTVVVRTRESPHGKGEDYETNAYSLYNGGPLLPASGRL